MDKGDTYYRRRIEEELAAAEQASDPAVSQIHHEFAQRYREMLGAKLPPVDYSEVRESLNGLNPA